MVKFALHFSFVLFIYLMHEVLKNKNWMKELEKKIKIIHLVWKECSYICLRIIEKEDCITKIMRNLWLYMY